MSGRHSVVPPTGSSAIGPYSPALQVGPFLFISGQIPLDPETGRCVDGDMAAQTRRALENIGVLLAAAGLSFAHIVRTTVFLTDMNDFSAMNAEYSRFFSEPYPARSTVQAARLPRDARVEIDAIAAADL